MKKIALILVTLIGTGYLGAQTLSFQLGDAAWEASLNDMNATAKIDLPVFQAEVQVDFGITPQVQNTLITQNAIQPAELYLAACLAQTSGKPVTEVLAVYKKNKGKGWGAVALSLGIKPGTPGFKALATKASDKAKKLKAKKNKGHSKK